MTTFCPIWDKRLSWVRAGFRSEEPVKPWGEHPIAVRPISMQAREVPRQPPCKSGAGTLEKKDNYEGVGSLHQSSCVAGKVCTAPSVPDHFASCGLPVDWVLLPAMQFRVGWRHGDELRPSEPR